MHKCQNKSVGNVYHLEQMVDRFFPYSQEQLGFDQPVTITFQSDDENASKMLGKTAYYDPSTLEVVLYTDNRHPKDVMRSLSHELVHHAQNCRGDFGAQNDTGAGYAQKDPHLRKMEREAYTKGNLIFRDFEDLIKTGKINIEIDFSDSGEPKMSLKEWKNNEINTKLMKKWGFLKESKSLEEGGSGDEHYQFDKKEREDELEEGAELEEDMMDRINKHVPGMQMARKAAAAAVGQELPDDDDEEDLDEGGRGRPAPGGVEARHLGDDPDTYVGPALGRGMAGGKRDPEGRPETPEYAGKKVKPRPGSRSAALVRGAPRENQEMPRKISVREAKQITRRIIERIRKEGK